MASYKPRKRTRTENALEIAIGAVVFVRKARAQGCVNTVKEITFWEIAQERNITEFSIKTVKRLARESLEVQGEYDLIDF